MKRAARAKKRRGLALPLVLGAVILITAAVALAVVAEHAGGPRTPLAGVSTAFSLTDMDGRAVSDSDFRGRWQLVYFGYTHCPDSCPTALNAIAEGLDRLGPRRDRIVPLFITLDPERDHPAELKDYADAFHAGIIGLTGSPEQIARAAKGFHIAYQKHPLPGRDDYGVDHTSLIFLVDPGGKPVAFFPDAITPDRLARRLAEALG